MKGIDISKHNGIVNLNQVKNSGIDFVIIRLGYGSDITSQDDIKFETNYKNAKNAGLLVGVYIYSYAKTSTKALSEAQHCARLLKGKTIDFPVWYDLEDRSIMNADWNVLTNTFANELAKSGHDVGIYTFASALHKLNETTKNKYPIWIASWGSNNGRVSIKNPGYYMWQYTSRGVVNGVVGLVDMNVLNADVKPTNTKVKGKNKSVYTLALETLKGKYGDNAERKKKLGEHYNEVQNKINEWYTIAQKVKDGKYGNGDERKKKLGKDYNGVQYIINQGEK